MEKVLAKLKRVISLTGEIEQRLEEFWYYGVDRIADERIRGVVKYLLEEIVPWQFYVSPASSSAKYHPSWQNRPGGLVRHTTEMAIASERELQQYPSLTDEQCNPLPLVRDIVLAAVALHDAFKNGLPWGERTDYENHHRIAADQWRAAASTFGVEEYVIEFVYEAIFWHAGRWTPGYQPGDLEKLGLHTRVVHGLDMVWSDRNLGLMFTPKPILPQSLGR